MKFCLRAILAPMALTVAVLYAQSGEMHHHHAATQADQDGPVVAVSGLTIPDVQLVDQHGKKVRFYSDLIKGRVVAINTIFTTCTTICPLMGANIAKLSKMLSDAGDSRVNLISISIDPVVDTPERLEEWSRKFGRTDADWTLLTGPKPEIDGLLKALQVFTPEKQDHAPVLLIGGDGAGSWARASALLSPPRLAELIHARVELNANHAMPRFE